MCAQLHDFSLWRLTWVFDGTWKTFHEKVCPVTRFFAVETNLSFWWDLEKFPRKSVPSHTFLRCGDYLKFLMGLGKFRQKGVTSYTFFSLWRLTWVFDGTWKTFHKKVCPVTRFVRYGDYRNFWMGLRKVLTKMCAQLHVFSLWRLTWVFDGTWKTFHKKVFSVICFLAVETNLGFWWDLEKFSQKCVPSHTFLRCGDYLEFLMGLGKTFTKKCAQSHVSSLWRLS